MLSTFVCSLGLYVGLRFLTMKTLHEDQKSFYWYNVRFFHEFTSFLGLTLPHAVGMAHCSALFTGNLADWSNNSRIGNEIFHSKLYHV
jgi:hypothetical protein